MENALIFKQILLTNSLRTCMKVSLENLYLNIKGLKAGLDIRLFEKKIQSTLPRRAECWKVSREGD